MVRTSRKGLMWVARVLSIIYVSVIVSISGCASYIELQPPGDRPMKVRGTLYRPDGNGPFPAVIVLHGSSGDFPYHARWATWLRAEGYVAFVPISFSAAHDVFAAAEGLRTLPFVVKDRIAVIGTSWGGTETIYAGIDQARAGERTLRALVALYPNCTMSAYTGSAPLLLLLGGQDNWTPAAPCQRLAEAAQAKGRRVEVVLYPDAQHGFDNPDLGATPKFVGHARQGLGATIAYDSRAHADAEKQIRRFLADHLK